MITIIMIITFYIALCCVNREVLTNKNISMFMDSLPCPNYFDLRNTKEHILHLQNTGDIQFYHKEVW